VARARRRGRWTLGLLGALVAVVLLVLGGTAARVVAAGRSDDAPSGGSRTADAILVLGAAQFDGRPQEYLAARLDHARELYRTGAAARRPS